LPSPPTPGSASLAVIMQQLPRQPVSHRWVWIGLVALAVVVLGVFVAGYWFLVRYEDKVARHVPRGSLVALRLDIEQVVLYQPVRKRIFPVLDGAKTESNRLARLNAETGVNLGMDLREVLVAVLPAGQYLIAVGGLFPESGLLAKALRVLPSGHSCTPNGARVQCVLKDDRLWLEQAADGVVLASNSEQVLAAAAIESEEGIALGLQRAPIAFAADWQQARSAFPLDPRALGLPEWVSNLTAVRGKSDLGDPLEVEVVLNGVPVNEVEGVRSWLQQVQNLAGLVRGPDVAGERGLLARATVEVTASGAVALRSYWERKDVERAASAVADGLAAALDL
jgi:hypothetical protein